MSKNGMIDSALLQIDYDADKLRGLGEIVTQMKLGDDGEARDSVEMCSHSLELIADVLFKTSGSLHEAARYIKKEVDPATGKE